MRKYHKYKNSNVKWIGQIPDSWLVSNIRYNTKVVGRIGYRGYTVEDIVGDGEGAISLSPSNIQNQKFDLSKRTYISWDKYEESPEIQVFEGDIILVKTASVGKVAYVDTLVGEKATINPQLVVFKEVTLSPRFLYYYLISNDFQYQIDRDNYGGVVGTLTQASINSYKILIPSDFEQTKIAQYLDHQTAIIDQLIQKKEKLVQLLKEKRQAVINEAVTKGLNPNAKMKNSGIEWLGEVPEEWEVTKMKFIAKLNPSKSEIESSINDEDFVSFLPMDKVGEDWSYDKTSLAKYNEVSSGLTYFKEGDIIMAKITPCFENGKATILESLTNGIGFGSTEFHTIRPLKIDRSYLFYVTRSDYFMSNGESFMTGSAGQKRVPTSFVNDFYVPIPKSEEQVEIATFIEDYFKRSNILSSQLFSQIEKLKEYRQSIISEAVTGKIDVRDWQPNKKQVA